MEYTSYDYVAFFFVALIFVIIVVAGIASSAQEKKKVEKLSQPNSLLRLKDKEMSSLLKELSGWIYNCKKCSGNQYYIEEANTLQFSFRCSHCNSKHTLKTNAAFYKIEVLENIVSCFNEIISIMNKDNLIQDYITNIDFNKRNAAINNYIDSLENKYFSYKLLKKRIRYGQDISQLRVFSEGSKLDEALKRLETKKIDGLETKRKKLSITIVKEWNYKRITTGSKGLTIKSWAKKSGLKCIDGSKCGGVKFSQIDDSEITFGHIIPQSWGKEYPHMLETIHHPDNLYLTCRSCNSSLNSGFPDPELKSKISNEFGTIGDWLRNHLTELQSSEAVE